jgi:hypothetical protein
VKQDSVWYWAKQPAVSGDWTIFYCGNAGGQPGRFSAFAVAELGEMLPHDWWIQYHVRPGGIEPQWYMKLKFGGEIKDIGIIETSEADARAKMLIYLVENGLYSVSTEYVV